MTTNPKLDGKMSKKFLKNKECYLQVINHMEIQFLS